ncbi:MAG: Vacuolar protein sorting-associated protein 4 [Cirrosporium novae-zelandiae]|nr:MAG: Vacuolar protein sorting-associated protein 4 [Cirrosporium novae-zelandiae]
MGFLESNQEEALKRQFQSLRPQPSSSRPLFEASSSQHTKNQGLGASKTSCNEKACRRSFRNVKEEPGIRGLKQLGGLSNIKKELRTIALSALKYSHLFRHSDSLGMPNNFGVFLHGPQGTGKTVLVSGFAKEYGFPMFDVSCGMLAHGLFGDSEAFVQMLFQLASKGSSCVIFLDGCDAVLSPSRNNDGSHAKRDEKAMVGLNNQGTSVFVFGATNYLGLIKFDTGFGRRFETQVHVGLPGEAAMVQILEPSLKIIYHTVQVGEYLELAEAGLGLTGADISVLMIKMVRKEISNLVAAKTFTKEKFNGKDILVPCRQNVSESIKKDSPGYNDSMVWCKPFSKRDILTTLRHAKRSVTRLERETHEKWSDANSTMSA